MRLVLCTLGGPSESGIREALTLARRVADGRGLALSWLLCGEAGPAVDELAAAYGAANVDVISDARLAGCGPDTLVAALAGYCRQSQPTLILFNQTAATRLIAPRLAGRLRVPVVMNAFAVVAAGEAIDVTATAFGGDTHVVYRLAAPVNVISVVTTSIVSEPAATPTRPARREIGLDLAKVEERFSIRSAPPAQGRRLEDAEIIVAGGRGLGSAGNFGLVKELADSLGGMWGGSRAIVDEGWLDSSRQIGLTGKITRPSLYVAAGISGASQHMAGCSAAGTIVAINRDPDAAIFRYARYGIVGDCLEVLPELIKACRARKVSP